MKIRALTLGLLLVASGIHAQEELENARRITVQASTSTLSTSGRLQLEPVSNTPRTPVSCPIPASGGSLSGEIRLFPGTNIIGPETGIQGDPIEVTVNVNKPSIRVELGWGGSRQDYDLYVNGVSYLETESSGGKLDHDVIDQEEPAKENITYEEADPGLHSISVNYYAFHTETAQPLPTTVRVYVDDEQVYTATKTLSTPGAGRTSESTWYVGTMAIHAGDKAGGYVVGEESRRDLAPQKSVMTDLFAPVTNFNISRLTAQDNTTSVTLGIGESAQIIVEGTVNSGTENQQDGAILGQLESADENVATVDETGVICAQQAGATTVKAKTGGSNQPPVNVIVLKTYHLQFLQSQDLRIDTDSQRWCETASRKMLEDQDGAGPNDTSCRIKLLKDGATTVDATDLYYKIDKPDKITAVTKRLRESRKHVYIVHEINFDGRNCAGVTQMTPGKITQEMIVKQDAPDNALPHELGHCRTITHNPGDIGTGTSIPTEEHLMWPDNSLNNWLKMAPITSKFEKP